ncbi:hypothetical protein LTR27_001773 [Elasticomyces elasticus]|nr:hypothetical protein LTR27_001773 [Elasticomyces elasticus]
MSQNAKESLPMLGESDDYESTMILVPLTSSPIDASPNTILGSKRKSSASTSGTTLNDDEDASSGRGVKRQKILDATDETHQDHARSEVDESPTIASSKVRKVAKPKDKEGDKIKWATRTQSKQATMLAKPVFYTDKTAFETARTKQKEHEAKLDQKTKAEAKEREKVKEEKAKKEEAESKVANGIAEDESESSIEEAESIESTQDQTQTATVTESVLDSRETSSTTRTGQRINHDPPLELRPHRPGLDLERPEVYLVLGCQKNETKDLSGAKPMKLIRVDSTKGWRHTQGTSTEQQIKPAIAVGKLNTQPYPSIYDFGSLVELILNFGNRILWNRRHNDQFTSYTTSLLFGLVHAKGRHERKEEGITIASLDTRLATKDDVKKSPAEFYWVPGLSRILGVTSWAGWSIMPYGKFIAPWYSHEYVAQGIVNLAAGSSKQVSFADLVKNGLYDFASGLHNIEELEEMKKLYSRCVQMRVLWYQTREPVPFTQEHLNHAARLARLFATSTPDTDEDTQASSNHGRIPLYMFLSFVSLSNRNEYDPEFLDFIKQNFTAHDVQDIMYPSMTRIPNNLPEFMQYMQRVREACTALGLPIPGENAVASVDLDFDYTGVWHGKLKDITVRAAKPKKEKQGVKKGKMAQAREIAGISEEEIATREDSSEPEDDQDDGMGTLQEGANILNSRRYIRNHGSKTRSVQASEVASLARGLYARNEIESRVTLDSGLATIARSRPVPTALCSHDAGALGQVGEGVMSALEQELVRHAQLGATEGDA